MITTRSRPWRPLGHAFTILALMAMIFPFLSTSGPVAASPAPAATSGPAQAIQVGGDAMDDQGKPGSWNCAARAGFPESPDWYVGDRFGAWSPDNGALGAALPDGYVAAIASRVQARYFHLVLYSPHYGDLVVDSYFNTITPEAGTTFPTGRFDPVGEPKLFYDRGQLKIVIGLWGGGGGTPDRGGRIYTWCGIVPGTP
jgi:hypothetical protein